MFSSHLVRQIIEQLENASQTNDTAAHRHAVQNLIGEAALQEDRLAVVLLHLGNKAYLSLLIPRQSGSVSFVPDTAPADPSAA